MDLDSDCALCTGTREELTLRAAEHCVANGGSDPGCKYFVPLFDRTAQQPSPGCADSGWVSVLRVAAGIHVRAVVALALQAPARIFGKCPFACGHGGLAFLSRARTLSSGGSAGVR